MYAIIKTGGKQYRIQEGDVIYVDRLEHEVGSTISMIPLCTEIEGVVNLETTSSTVSMEIQDHLRDKKVWVVKKKRRKKYRKKMGYRAQLTSLKIVSIKE